jgi:hypothetical protein
MGQPKLAVVIGSNSATFFCQRQSRPDRRAQERA